MNKVHYMKSRIVGSSVFEMIVDLAYTLMNKMLAYSLAITN